MRDSQTVVNPRRHERHIPQRRDGRGPSQDARFASRVDHQAVLGQRSERHARLRRVAPAPRQDRAGSGERERVVVPARESRDAAQPAASASAEGLHQRGFRHDERSRVLLLVVVVVVVAGCRRRDARLREVVQAPCVHVSGGREREAVELAGGDGGDLVVFLVLVVLAFAVGEAHQAGHESGGAIAFHDGAAELGLFAAAPGVDGAVGVEGQHVIATSGEGGDVFKLGDENWSLLDS